MKTFIKAVPLCFLLLANLAFAQSDGEITRAISADDAMKVRRLVEAGTFNLDSRIAGNTLTAIAARSASLNVLRYLVRAKANLNAANSRNETPLMIAAFFPDEVGGEGKVYARHEAAVEILLAAGVELENSPESHTALGYAALAGHARIVKRLLNAGANPNGTAKYGVGAVNTPLIMASLSGSAESAHLLLANGADPLIINNYGQDALFYAERDGQKDIIKMLKCALTISQLEKFEQTCK